jgi:hypothetical protein
LHDRNETCIPAIRRITTIEEGIPMKRWSLCLAVLALAVSAASAFAENPEIAAIRDVIEQAYVSGIHNDRDPAKIRAGFHESFVMFSQSGDGVTQLTRDAWIERIEAAKAKGDQGPRPETTATITVLDLAGSAAVTKVELFREGRQVFTDYISLYRFESGWKIVGKIFHRH